MAGLVHRAWLAGAEPKRLGVLRGGAFFNNQNNARCAYRNNNDPDNRNNNDPDNRNNNNGFRIVVSTFFAPEMPCGS